MVREPGNEAVDKDFPARRTKPVGCWNDGSRQGQRDDRDFGEQSIRPEQDASQKDSDSGQGQELQLPL